jgi:hypothetical protein
MWRLPPGCTADDLLNARRIATAVVHHQQQHQVQQVQQVQHGRAASKLTPTAAAAAMLYNGLVKMVNYQTA